MRDQPVIRQAWWEQHPFQSISDEVCPPQPVSASSSLFQPEDAMFSSLHGIATGVIILQLISLKMSLLILSNLRCDSMAVSDGLNPSFPHPLLPFPPPCSHLFSCAAVSACATSLCCSRELPTRLILAVQVRRKQLSEPVLGSSTSVRRAVTRRGNALLSVCAVSFGNFR